MTSSSSDIIIGKQGERWRVTPIKLPYKDADGNTAYQDAQKMDLLDELPKGEITLPLHEKDRKVRVFEFDQDGKMGDALPGSVIPAIHKDMKIHPDEETPSVIPVSYGARNDTWKSTGARSKHYDPMPEIPYDTDLTGNREAQTWGFNVLPLAAEQKEDFLEKLIRDQARIDNLESRKRVLPRPLSKRKMDTILEDEISKDNPKGRTGVKTYNLH